MSIDLSPGQKKQLVRILKQISLGCDLEALAVVNQAKSGVVVRMSLEIYACLQQKENPAHPGHLYLPQYQSQY